MECVLDQLLQPVVPHIGFCKLIRACSLISFAMRQSQPRWKPMGSSRLLSPHLQLFNYFQRPLLKQQHARWILFGLRVWSAAGHIFILAVFM